MKNWTYNARLIKLRLYTTAFIVVLLDHSIHAQTFSRRDTNYYTSVYLDVIIEPNGYQTIGIAYDSIAGSLEQPTIVQGFDLSGELLYSKEYYFENKFWNPNLDCNARINDETAVFMAIENTAESDTVYNTVVWLNNSGDTLQTRRYVSPYFQLNNDPTYHFVPTVIIASPDGEYLYFVSQMADAPPIQNNFLIKKITA